MMHIIAAGVVTLSLLSPLYFSAISADAVGKDSGEAKELFYRWLSMVSGCIFTVILSALFYGMT